MKTRMFTTWIWLAFMMALIAAALTITSAQAQCQDAAGAPIPCPPPEGGDSGGRKTPTATLVYFTNTPLPIANPTQETVTADWTGTCTGTSDNVSTCIAGLVSACKDSGGSASSGSGSDGHTVHCTYPANIVVESTPVPLSNSPQNSSSGSTATCHGARLCVGEFTQACEKAGGTIETSNIDPSTNIPQTFTCSLPAVLPPTPRPLSSAPEEDLIGTCSEVEGDVLTCLDELQKQCEDGLLVIIVDLYATGGTGYKVYCIPHENVPQFDLPIAIPVDGTEEGNWTGGCEGGPGLDACLDIYSGLCDEEGGDFSVWYDDEGGAGVYCENQSEAGKPVPSSTPRPITFFDVFESAPPVWPPWLPWLSGSVLGILIGIFAAVGIPAFMKNARKAKTAEATTNVKKMYDGARATDEEESGSSAVVSLGKLGRVENTGTEGASKPKPTPPPKPKSPPGDFDSDGDVDHSDF